MPSQDRHAQRPATVKTLSGCRRPPRRCAMATRWSASSTTRVTPPSSRPDGSGPRTRTTWPRARAPRSSPSSARRGSVKAGVRGQQERLDPPRRELFADAVERMRLLQSEGAADGPRERAEIRAAPEPVAEIAGQRAHVRAGAAADVEDADRSGGVGVVPLDELERVDRHGPWPQAPACRRRARPGRRAGRPRAPPNGPAAPARSCRGRTPAPPRPPRGRAAAPRRVSSRRRCRRSWSVPPRRPWRGSPSRPRGGTRPSAWPAPGRPAGRPCAKGSSVPPWPTRRTLGEAAHQRHDVMGRRPRWLGDHEDAVDESDAPDGRDGSPSAGRPRAAAERPPGPAAGPADRGSSIVAPAARACPPPPKAPVNARRVHATVARAHRDACALALVLEEDDDLGALGLRQQVDEPFGHLRAPRRPMRCRRPS